MSAWSDLVKSPSLDRCNAGAGHLVPNSAATGRALADEGAVATATLVWRLAGLGCDLLQKILDFRLQRESCVLDGLRCGEHCPGRVAGFRHRIHHLIENGRDDLRSLGGLCDILRNLTGDSALLSHRRGNGGGMLVDILHSVGNSLNGVDGAFG